MVESFNKYETESNFEDYLNDLALINSSEAYLEFVVLAVEAMQIYDTTLKNNPFLIKDINGDNHEYCFTMKNFFDAMGIEHILKLDKKDFYDNPTIESMLDLVHCDNQNTIYSNYQQSSLNEKIKTYENFNTLMDIDNFLSKNEALILKKDIITFIDSENNVYEMEFVFKEKTLKTVNFKTLKNVKMKNHILRSDTIWSFLALNYWHCQNTVLKLF